MSAAFIPSTAISETHSVLDLTDSQLAQLAVKPYVLAEGETVSTVADRFQLSVAQLKKLNQLRKHSKPFEKLQAGDEIDVPAEDIKDDVTPVKTEDNQFTQKLASGSTTAAGILQSSDIAGSVAGQAKGFAVNQANQEINNWLSGAGTARAKLNIDNKGRVDGSELDLLVPLNDTPSSLTFTQFGVRHIDDRTMANLGLGQRHYIDNEWMFGYNAFFDYDLRRDHSRAGLGLELARDYLKFGANSYFRTSNWRASPDVTDYDERPANGFDLRTEAYIPALPQLGGSLTYEQYYGDEVGLFGKNTRSRNPAAMTAGLSYTPFPLLNLGVERKQGTTSGEGDTRFTIGLTYDINGSWSRQIDPDAVNNTRTLAGTRYDLVERNNEIVLEYRKQELIRLKADPLVTGESGQTKDLNLSINAKYGLSSVRWDDAALTAAGGSIRQSGEKYSVTLPSYTEGGVNSWTISAVAVDRKGNVSNRAETQITVTSAGISLTESAFYSEDNTLPADAQSTSTVILKLADGAGNPVTGLAGDIVLNLDMAGTSGTVPTFSSFKETSPGVYEATMTTGTRSGTLVVTPVVRGTSLAPVSIEIVAPVAPSAESLTLSGKLAVGETLTGSYTFLQPQAEQKAVKNTVTPEDKSVYVWGEKGKTESDIASGKTVTTSGQIPGYTLQPADAGKIIELSLLPKNSLNMSGKVLTVDTSMDSAAGNGSTNGGAGGTVVNPDAEPKVSGLTLSGTLELNQTLSGRYQFDANTGEPTDRSAYAWGVRGKTAEAVAVSTDVVPSVGNVKPYTLGQSDLGNVLELSVQARNGASKSGNILTVDTSMTNADGNGTSGGGIGGIVINPGAQPKVSGLRISGKLEANQKLSGHYQFDASGGDTTDRSAYAWGVQGKTAEAVATTTEVVTSSGNVEPYPIQSSDAGKVLELSVQARNGASKSGNTLTVNTAMTNADGNDTSGGGSDGSVVDPDAEPKVSGLTLTGTLQLHQKLNGNYQFDANTGDKNDRSAYAWGVQGTTADALATTTNVVTSSGSVEPYPIELSDVGKVLELSVQARNGASKSGNTLTVNTNMGIADGNGTSGGGSGGTIVNPDAEPKVSGLTLTGKLEVSQKLYGNYQFDANTGDKEDRSAYAWGEQGKTANALATTPSFVTSSGSVEPYEILASDAGKVLELSVQARNGASKSGNTLTVNTAMTNADGNGTSGDANDGTIINPTAAPEITNLAIKGSIAVGGKVSGSYQFNANNGYPVDASLYAWSQPGAGAGGTASAVTTTTDTIAAEGVVPEKDITSADSGKVIELSVLARNSQNVRGLVSTVTSKVNVGMTLQSVPERPEYASNFKYVRDEKALLMKGLIWPYDQSTQKYAIGSFTFRNASPFTARSVNGLVRVVADDDIESVVVNGKSYSLPATTCKWNQNNCTVSVNNLIPHGNNNIEIVANNQGSPGDSNPGALNVVVVDLDFSQVPASENLIDTKDPSKWTFE
ncbi:inverse autotransporter beta domain-containing protein [Enterobacter kobei]|nr:inverse autotransporter beta domain-containing protein [Enterobacter kobei]